jgi:hypothetical protein
MSLPERSGIGAGTLKVHDSHEVYRGVEARPVHRSAAALVAGLAAMLALLLAAGAQAGTYTIDNCPSAPAANENAGPWTVFGAPQNVKGTCTGGVGSWIGPLGGSMGPATVDGVQVAVPAGSDDTIRGARVWWYVPQQISGATTFAIAGVNTGGVEEAGTPKNSSTTPDEWALPSNTTELTLADYCSNDDAGAGCAFGGGENPDLELMGAQLTIEDNAPPSGTVTGGVLAGTGTASGIEGITYAAQDGDSGVRRVQLLLDGRTVAEHDYLAECPYQNFTACPTSLSGELRWDTSAAINGTHELSVRVISAAEDAAIVDDHTITIYNQRVEANGGGINGGRGQANGEPCAGEALELLVNGRRKPPIVQYGRPVTVRGVLHCGTVPIRDARIAIVTVGGPSSAAINTSVRTALDGSFTYKLPKGPDRTLHFSYTAYSNDPGPSASATTTISVRPRIRLEIRPHISSNRNTIHWSGTIAGGPFPREGVTLVVEVREGRHWRIFDQTVANAKGRFHYHYKFHATTEPTTYLFRVALPDTGSQDYPYVSGASNTINVHVTP